MPCHCGVASALPGLVALAFVVPFVLSAFSATAGHLRHFSATAVPGVTITNHLPLVTVRSPPHHHEGAWPFLWLFFGKTPVSA